MKAYDFIIIANPSIKNTSNNWFTILPMEYLHRGIFTGTVIQLFEHINHVKNLIIEENNFEPFNGFHISAILQSGQRKPAKWDQTRKLLASHYHALPLNIAA